MGQHHQVDEASFEPKPVYGHIPVLIGSSGKRMMRFIARYADQWDGHYAAPDEYVQLGARLSAYCGEIGRDPAEIRWMRQTGRQELDLVEDEERFRGHVINYVRAGLRSFIFSVPPGPPTATLRRITEHVIPELRSQFQAGDLTN